ncbi:MAG: polysaccharide biosynthesis/export family protein [Candidatus Aegiribacteria sp.]
MLLILLVVMAQSAPLPVGPAQDIPAPAGDGQVLELADRNSYRLGPGDVVTVVTAGGSSQYLMSAGVTPWAEYSVGGDGYLSVSGIGAVSVEGLTIEEAQGTLQRMAARYFPSLEVTLSLKEPRMLRVSLGGMVNQPGTYVLSALNRVSDALEMAGGISTFGSRLGVMYTGSGDTLEVDLNMVPGTMSFRADPFLVNNADVIMSVSRNPVFILSASRSIETRELGPGEDIGSLLSRMGGVTGDINLRGSRIIRNMNTYPIWTDSSGFNAMALQPGDTVMIVTMQDSVIVGGAVSIPGPVPYNPENTVYDYVIYAGGGLSTTGGGITVRRNGRSIDFECEVREAHLLPGDVVDVSYSWFEKNDALISLITSAISLGITLYTVTK